MSKMSSTILENNKAHFKISRQESDHLSGIKNGLDEFEKAKNAQRDEGMWLIKKK